MAPLRYEHGEYRGPRRSQVGERNFREDEEMGSEPPNPRRVREKLITEQQRQEPQIVANSIGIVFLKTSDGTLLKIIRLSSLKRSEEGMGRLDYQRAQVLLHVC